MKLAKSIPVDIPKLSIRCTNKDKGIYTANCLICNNTIITECLSWINCYRCDTNYCVYNCSCEDKNYRCISCIELHLLPKDCGASRLCNYLKNYHNIDIEHKINLGDTFTVDEFDKPYGMINYMISGSWPYEYKALFRYKSCALYN